MTVAPVRTRLRWLAITIFLLFSTLNYLDRQLLAAVAPDIQKEFHLSSAQYGWVVTAFSIVYAAVAPLAGLFIDRAGLNAGASIAILVWSCAGVATGLVNSFAGLLGCRTALGIAEAAGIPCFGKANATYMEQRELSMGTAMNQLGISIALVAAPLIAGAMSPRYGWRSPFLLCGALGFVWVSVWLFLSKRIPRHEASTRTVAPARVTELLRDRRLWGLALSTVFIMSLYTLWTNWTTKYFVSDWHMTQNDANVRFAWVPAVFGAVGGFFGGWLSVWFMRRGAKPIASRLRASWICAVILLGTAAIPYMPTRGLAAIAVSMSFFMCVAISVHLYALPIDLFGPARAGFGVATLTCAYGIMQAFASPMIGGMVDHFGFHAVCVTMAAAPLLGVGILQATTR